MAGYGTGYMVLHYNGEPEDGPVRVVVDGETVIANSLMVTDYGWMRLDLDGRYVYYQESDIDEFEPARRGQDTSNW